MQTSRDSFFDVLRIVAILLVITSHYSYMFDNSTVLYFPREYLTGGIGRLGVSLFFMISGALTYLSLRSSTTLEYYRRRAISVLVPYNITWIFMGLLILALTPFFVYPYLPLQELLNGQRSLLSLVPTILGFDHYLHGVYGIHTAYFTGEWFIGCIILLYILSPLLFGAMIRSPGWSIAIVLLASVLAYDKNIENPYWSAQVRVGDFMAGMVFVHFQPWFIRHCRRLALVGVFIVIGGVMLADPLHRSVRTVLFPLMPISMLFSVAFFFILLTIWQWVQPFFHSKLCSQIISSLASRAYIIMLIQHVVVIFISANLNMAVLNGWQATLLFLAVLLGTERLSCLIKPLSVKGEKILLRYGHQR